MAAAIGGSLGTIVPMMMGGAVCYWYYRRWKRKKAEAQRLAEEEEIRRAQAEEDAYGTPEFWAQQDSQEDSTFQHLAWNDPRKIEMMEKSNKKYRTDRRPKPVDVAKSRPMPAHHGANVMGNSDVSPDRPKRLSVLQTTGGALVKSPEEQKKAARGPKAMMYSPLIPEFGKAAVTVNVVRNETPQH